ncbi:MAG TPA: hypothetical protein VHH36_06955 [Candidatus Thermoplasmatota archaeon]|nr:hypothetical protein [Candidatus Thermoplasmatota archaeon]
MSPLKILGIQTGDFSAYYDLVQVLRARGLSFVQILPGEPVPDHVGVVVTTAGEVAGVSHPSVVVYTTPEETLTAALGLLEGPGPFRRVVVGIDPGERPGVAILGDGRVLRLAQAPHPEAVGLVVSSTLATLSAEHFLVRIGDGAPTFRDRILRSLAPFDVRVEVVDERRSTPPNAKPGERDTVAATRIALTPGEPLRLPDAWPVVPTEGELRDIQRKSRLASEGAVTISRHLARSVALGRLTLQEAVSRQQQKA